MTKSEILSEIYSQNLVMEIYDDLHREVVDMNRRMKNKIRYENATIKAINKIAANPSKNSKVAFDAIVSLCEEE